MQKHINGIIQTTRQCAVSQIAQQTKQIFNRVLYLLFIVSVLAVLASIDPLVSIGYASSPISVTGPGDGVANDGVCSLREAIQAANSNSSVNECSSGDPGPDTINLTVFGPYNLTLGELTVDSEITLNGNGETISAGGLSRIFVVNVGRTLSLNDVTLRDGVGDAGGAIYSQYNSTVNISNSAILNNVGDEGGAIHSRGYSTVNISNSAILNNAAIMKDSSSGGGINNWGGTVNITNSTISGNRANAGGGGLANLTLVHPAFIFGTVNLTNVTITNNTADLQSSGEPGRDGGGVWSFGVLNVKNSIIAGNSDNTPPGGIIRPDCVNFWSLTSQQNNFIGDNSGCDIPFTPGNPNGDNDFVGTGDSPIDPLLDILTGQPAYHPLRSGSPAIDHIPNGVNGCGTTITTDQRGVARPQGDACDIGAYEFKEIVQDTTPPVLSLPADITAEGNTTNGAHVTFVVTAIDDTDPDPTVSCDKNSGDFFELGTTIVTCTATDASDNQSIGSFNITVIDTTPPVLSVPADVTIECDQSTDPANTGLATATDIVDPNPLVAFDDVQIPGDSPNDFTLTRTWTGTDFSGNASSAAQNITVADTTAPVLNAPPDLEVIANTAGGYTGDIGTATAVDNCDPNLTIVNDAPGVFPLGDTIVTWTATDASGNQATATQKVTVKPLPVAIDIKPGSDPNSINCENEKEVISVAILTTGDFEATTVDHTTVTFAGAGETHVDKKSGEPRRHEEDADKDGDIDLVFHFRLGDTNLTCDSEEGTLTGEIVDGPAIEGTDAVRMVKK
jgi:CSLREA domain-containing protein